MIICDDVRGVIYTNDQRVKQVSLSCDSKSEIKDDQSQMEIIGLPENTIIGFGSTAMTVDMDYAKYDSTGHWHWVGETS